jgi:hypothetical protein
MHHQITSPLTALENIVAARRCTPNIVCRRPETHFLDTRKTKIISSALIYPLISSPHLHSFDQHRQGVF